MSLRSSGVLLHPTSLPSGHGIGGLGESAYRFADFLAKSGQHFWQILPLNPTDGKNSHSPYHSVSAFAGNPLMICPEILMREGLLEKSELRTAVDFPEDKVDFKNVIAYKTELLELARRRFFSTKDRREYRRFCENESWLDDYALFTSLKERFGDVSWTKWPAELRDRDPDALQSAAVELKDRIQLHRFLQFIFFKQWRALKNYCNRRDIRIIGDTPIYQPLDSSDVWSHPQLYKLDDNKEPLAVSGAPPDYFSETGQLWGHPVYRWKSHRKDRYKWWMDRIAQNMSLYDMVRIDHFRGLVGYWEIAAGDETALNGQWVPGPGNEFFDRLVNRFGRLPVIAEDLGEITADVREIIRHYELPGMRVLLFAFGDDFPKSSFLPHHHIRNCVVYTGTHDNNTVRGWIENEADKTTKRNLYRYLGREVKNDELPREMIRIAMQSTADTAIIPMQDILGLGQESRMNHPAIDKNNWLWRMKPGAASPDTAAKLSEVTTTFDRV